ncbi:MAG: hypothetical protein K8H74_12765 [Notoacmeibacter sp.]|nr:hypothetical protein [Notoacmeibacter sp.]
MRFLHAIIDGHGFVHVGSGRSPDGVRRKLSADTGTAVIAYIALATDISPTQTLMHLRRKFAAHMIGRDVFDVPASEITREIWWRMLLLPKIGKIWSKPRHLARRALWTVRKRAA